MGLDMYLSIRKTGNDESKPIEIGYWRKANAIHRFMVGEEAYQSGEDNCKEFVIPAGKMKALSAHCWRVLMFFKNKEQNPDYTYELDGTVYTRWEDYAELELPTAEGFFFGDTDYDEYYIQDLKDTIEIVEKWEEVYKQEGPCETIYYAWY